MNLLRPPRLRAGDRVRVVTMSATFPKNTWQGAAAFCEALGLEATFGKSMSADPGYLGRDPRRRADDFNAAVADDSVRAIFLFRGGNTASEVLRFIDYDALRKNPKVVAGFSDHSSVVNAVHARADIVSFMVPPMLQGPLGRSAANRLSVDSFRALAMDAREGVEMLKLNVETWRKGTARGPIAAANLAILRNLQGTPFAPSLAGKILAWEEIGEGVEDINVALHQLANTGGLDALAGMVVGHLEGVPRSQHGWTLKELALHNVHAPVLKTRAFGHFRPCFTLPLGVEASLDAGKKKLVVEGRAVD